MPEGTQGGGKTDLELFLGADDHCMTSRHVRRPDSLVLNVEWCGEGEVVTINDTDTDDRRVMLQVNLLRYTVRTIIHKY